MCKKSYVTVSVNKRMLKLYVEDISTVYTAIKKKRPTLPAF